MPNIVKATYQDFSVSFTEDGWFNATAVAERFKKRSVLYCICFSHGLMKIGMTSNMKKRLNTISSHGLLIPLFSWILIRPIEGGASKGERIALCLSKSITKQVRDEVFKSADKNVMRSILKYAVVKAHKTRKKIPHFTEADYHEFARTSGIYGTILYLANKERKALGLEPATIEWFNKDRMALGLDPIFISQPSGEMQ